MCDGLNLAVSTKAALLRQGICEMGLFCQLFDRTGNFRPETMLLSCGVADLVATCFGGRNAKCGKEFARRRQAQLNHRNGASEQKGERLGFTVNEELTELWRDIEAELLGGQKLEGVGTCRELMLSLQSGNQHLGGGQFPLFRRIHEVAFEGAAFSSLFQWEL